jgi:predicted nucleic acid-binding protein
MGKRQATNPTVLHETYHTCVLKIRRRADKTVADLLDYMKFSMCLPITDSTAELGLKLALRHSLGGRDALVIASFAMSRQVDKFVTWDKGLLDIKKIKIGSKVLEISSPSS